MKLTIELVPSTCWCSNLRDHLSADEWNVVKKHTAKLAGNCCEICSGVGPKWPVECHEVWSYDDKNKIQTLIRTIALCPDCHQVKHFGLASINGQAEKALNHFMKVNEMSYERSIKYIQKSFDTYEKRSKKEWTLNIDWLNETFNCNVNSKRR